MDITTILLILLFTIIVCVIVGVLLTSKKDTEVVNQALEQQKDVGQVIDNGVENKETFLAIGGDGAVVNNQGTLVGNHIYTNGLLNQPWEEIVENVKNGKPLEDKTVLGAAAGDSFETAWTSHKDQIEVSEQNEIGVKSPEEIAEIEKKLNGGQNNNTSCLYSRGGSSKAKIILDPLGTRGVTDTYDTPERDRNHKIYDGGNVVYVPGYDINISNLPKELTINGKGWGKGFDGNTVKDYSTTETKSSEASAQQSITETPVMETFSSLYN